jgi:hypothetical protein
LANGELDYKTLNDIINNSKDIAYHCKTGSTDLDWYITNLVYGEIKTLGTILELNEKRCFKECFILLRSVLEKFSYFWLMLYGINHRWKVEYKIIPSEEEYDKPIKEIRDKHCERLRKLKQKGDKNLSEAETIKGHKEKNDTIIIIYKKPGIFSEQNKEKKDEPIPIFYFLLKDYKPDIAHLSHLKILLYDIPFRSDYIFKQKYLKSFFCFHTILENLLLNGLISNYQREIVSIHHHFFSKYIHMSMASIDIEISKRENKTEYIEIFYKLIHLYSAKFLQLYLDLILSKFSNRKSQRELTELEKYHYFKNKLKEVSKELWFYDDDPTSFDIEVSDQKKYFLKIKGEKYNNSITFYYEDPFKRLLQKNMVY